jgi:chromosome partitioning protein
LIDDVDINDVIRPTEMKNLWVAPATTDLAGAEIELIAWRRSEAEPVARGRERRLSELVEQVRDRYDYVIIDCPPSLGILTINALTAADGVLVPMQCEYYALEGLSALLATIDRVRRVLNPRLVVDGILFCMYDPRPNLTHQVTEEVRQHMGDKVFETVIPRNVRLSESPSHGKPILLYDRESRGCQSYLALADELVRREEKAAA